MLVPSKPITTLPYANLCCLCRNRDQAAHFSCPNGRTFFSSSIVWGEFQLMTSSTYNISNYLFLSRRNWAKTNFWTRCNLYANSIFLASWSSTSSRILYLDPNIPQVQGPVPQCPCVSDKYLPCQEVANWDTRSQNARCNGLASTVS